MAHLIDYIIIAIGLFAIINRNNIIRIYEKMIFRNEENPSPVRESLLKNTAYRKFLAKYKVQIPVIAGLILIIRGIIGIYYLK